MLSGVVSSLVCVCVAIYLFYLALGLLFPAAFGVHLVVLLALLWLAIRRPHLAGWRKVVLVAVETIYACVNPIIYLLFLQHPGRTEYGIVPSLPKNLFLVYLAWAALAAVWLLRFSIGNLVRSRPKLWRILVRSALSLSILISTIYLLKDAVPLLHLNRPLYQGEESLSRIFYYCFCASHYALYLIPIAIAWYHLRRIALSPDERGSEFILCSSSRAARLIPVLLVCSLLTLLGISRITLDQNQTRELLLRERGHIIAAAHKFQLSPRLLAAIVYKNQRQDVSRVRMALESFLMRFWVADSRGDLFFEHSLNISIGLAQIKPGTALAAAELSSRHDDSEAMAQCYKELRDLRLRGRDEESFMPVLSSLPMAPPCKLCKDTMVECLLDPERNLEFAAYLFSLYTAQWEATNSAWAIRDRPEILATLYQIGLERSHPKPNPVSNQFGQEIKAIVEAPWMVEIFP